MKKIIVVLMLLLFAVPCFAEPSLYCNLTGNITDDVVVVINGLPGSPIVSNVTKVPNPADPNDAMYYKADFDFSTLPDGNYTITAIARTMWGDSEASVEFPFVKSVSGSPQNLDLLLSK